MNEVAKRHLAQRRRRARNRFQATEVEPIVLLWVMRVLVPLGAHRTLLKDAHCLLDEALAEAVGLAQWFDPACEDFNVNTVRAELLTRHQEIEAQYGHVSVPETLRANVEGVASLVGLDATACRVLEFAVMLHSERLLDEVSELLGQLSTSKVWRALSVILDESEKNIRVALGSEGALSRSGLVTIDHRGSGTLNHKLDLLSPSFADQMVHGEADPTQLLRDMVTPVEPPTLELADYSHLSASLDILLPYLRESLATRRRGVNICLHGRPGTGKSELSRLLAKTLDCAAFEIAATDEEGDPIEGAARLRAFRAAQCFFAQSRTLLVFDEAEDVFDDGDRLFGRKSTAHLRKAWVNRMLETNPVPTLWLSNSIVGLDAAFVRRFDLVIELPVPPKSQRARILRQHCGDLLAQADIERFAEVEHLAPAVVAKAADVVRTIRHELDDKGIADVFEHLVGSSLEAQGHIPLRRHDASRLPEHYDPAFICADADLAQVAAGLKAARSGRLCLYGPPGTGKTAYARWLAEVLDLPLLVRRASDLLSMWVGESEKNIARVFRQAEAEKAILLLDEVDGFLQDRRGAQAGWEVTLVNEMLTQMEAFSGLFIASTNLLDGLDQAALRRFDLKVRFDFLRFDQAWELLRRCCRQIALPEPEAWVATRLQRLPRLTPGDFAAVLRRHRFHPLDSVDALITALEAECAVKQGGKAPIGFC